MFDFRFLLYAILGYVLGSLNFSIIIGKIFYKIDVREHGSKMQAPPIPCVYLEKVRPFLYCCLTHLKQ